MLTELAAVMQLPGGSVRLKSWSPVQAQNGGRKRRKSESSFLSLQTGDSSRQALRWRGEINTFSLILAAAELSPKHKYRGESMSSWLCCHTTHVLRNLLWASPGMEPTPRHDCSNSSWTRIPLSRGNLHILQIIPHTGQKLQQSQWQLQLKAQLHLRKTLLLQKTIFKQLHEVYRNNALYSKGKRSTKLYMKNDTEIETSAQNSLENQLRSCIVKTECN